MLTSRLPADYECADLTNNRSKAFSIQHHPSTLDVNPAHGPTDLPIEGAPAAASHDGHHRYAPDHPTMTRHIEAACRYGSIIERVAVLHGLLPSIIAGFGSHQSGWGLDLAPDGPDGSTDFTPRPHPTIKRQGALPEDGYGFGRGLMQLDYDRHEFARRQNWQDPEANIEAACRVVSEHRSHLRRRTMLQGFGLLRAAFAAFDCGLERVQHAARQGLDVDSPTTGQDYGRDILKRAGFFQSHGWD